MQAKEQFLNAYDREHATTMRLLRAYPADQLELRPHAKCKTAHELAWVFVVERGLGTRLWHDEFASGVPSGTPPTPPQNWNDLLAALDKAHTEFGNLVRSASDDQLQQKVHFFVAPKTMGEMTRLDMLWFMLSDQIHHRGQFSIYQRMAGGKVPSIYGPSADEPWM